MYNSPAQKSPKLWGLITMLARLIITIFAAAALALPAHAATVTVVPDLYNGKLPVISELMPDGQSIMGIAGDEVFRWTPAGGRVVLGSLGPRVLATAISADGSTVVGRRVSFSDQEAIRWTMGEGLTVLPRTVEFPHNPSPTHVSDDGSIVYGTAHTHFTQPFGDLILLGEKDHLDPDDYNSNPSDREGAFRWDITAGSQSFPDWAADSSLPSKFIGGISADGEVVAGAIDGIPTIWSNTAGLIQPADLPDNFLFANVENLSANGNTATGVFYKTSGGFLAPYPFSWSANGSFRPLTNPIDGFGNTLAVSDDGQIILGHGHGAGSTFVWTVADGIQSLTDYIAAHGFTLPFDGIHSAFQMSRDGIVLRGGTTQQIVRDDGSVAYTTIPWIVNLSAPVPEPTSLVAVVTGILLVANYRRATKRRY